jgi:hypothetical protein
MITEAQLKAVIDAQVKGGFRDWENALREHWLMTVKGANVWFDRVPLGFAQKTDESDWYGDTAGGHVLVMLLSPDGLKAAYGEARHKYEPVDPPVFSDGLALNAKPGDVYVAPVYDEDGAWEKVTVISVGSQEAAHRILDAWLSGGAEAAIATAFQLLPHA